ncbi:MAG: hypothetical protein HQ475_00405 [SAR202 cluster bacterium]|nr:hypothetical protein [SAR202 cluster bacterium]
MAKRNEKKKGSISLHPYDPKDVLAALLKPCPKDDADAQKDVSQSLD